MSCKVSARARSPGVRAGSVNVTNCSVDPRLTCTRFYHRISPDRRRISTFTHAKSFPAEPVAGVRDHPRDESARSAAYRVVREKLQITLVMVIKGWAIEFIRHSINLPFVDGVGSGLIIAKRGRVGKADAYRLGRLFLLISKMVFDRWILFDSKLDCQVK